MYVSLSTFWKHEYKQSILLSLEICIRKRDVLKNPVACQTCDKRRGYAHQNGRKIKSSPEKDKPIKSADRLSVKMSKNANVVRC